MAQLQHMIQTYKHNQQFIIYQLQIFKEERKLKFLILLNKKLTEQLVF